MGFTGKTIQAMTPKAEPFGYVWMIKRSRLPHVEAFHYGARPEIADSRKGDNFF